LNRKVSILIYWVRFRLGFNYIRPIKNLGSANIVWCQVRLGLNRKVSILIY
jgi:hypothetical protein